ncbi:hypothetical protein KUTeg_014903 [Tegillarca granosa]|uniref:GATA zinc finger domain-containing protein 1 n=1 Tax=Tegillarca granosa TaxID=220873 RepID=A0AA51Z0G9_TEGGR|nr:hypothetical protein KUTeg_014903 [Tegillarca granosa]WMX21249.1 GATA zinc finger domain-containing protein 1 [Tegillarca granosa]
MPLGAKPVCSNCKTNTSTIWRKGTQGDVICNACSTAQNGGNEKESTNGQNGNSVSTKNNGSVNNNGGPVLRKSARIKPSKHKFQTTNKPLATKGKSRRIIFKKSQPVKAPTAVSTVVTGDSVFYDGMYYQIGDIVSLVDEDGSVFYAQLRGFMQDQYGEKSAVISWLLPTQSSPRDRFDPSTYILGPEEDLPRKLEFMEFVCHAPSDYFKSLMGPYPTVSQKPPLCYIWTTVGPQIQPVPSIDEIFGIKETEKETVKKEKHSKKDKDKSSFSPEVLDIKTEK